MLPSMRSVTADKLSPGDRIMRPEYDDLMRVESVERFEEAITENYREVRFQVSGVLIESGLTATCNVFDDFPVTVVPDETLEWLASAEGLQFAGCR
jgi:hypothetical protein